MIKFIEFLVDLCEAFVDVVEFVFESLVGFVEDLNEDKEEDN